jgi:hypothetical protein
VQATTYGADHQVVLDGLAVAGPNYRGCANASVLSERDDAYLARLHDAGVRGARFTRQGLGLALSKEAYAAAIEKVKAAGGMLLNGPTEIPGIGMYANIRDTEGNRVSVLKPMRP